MFPMAVVPKVRDLHGSGGPARRNEPERVTELVFVGETGQFWTCFERVWTCFERVLNVVERAFLTVLHTCMRERVSTESGQFFTPSRVNISVGWIQDKEPVCWMQEMNIISSMMKLHKILTRLFFWSCRREERRVFRDMRHWPACWTQQIEITKSNHQIINFKSPNQTTKSSNWNYSSYHWLSKTCTALVQWLLRICFNVPWSLSRLPYLDLYNLGIRTSAYIVAVVLTLWILYYSLGFCLATSKNMTALAMFKYPF